MITGVRSHDNNGDWIYQELLLYCFKIKYRTALNMASMNRIAYHGMIRTYLTGQQSLAT